MTDHSHHAKNVADAASAFISVAALAQHLPVAAALLSVVWYLLRIYDWVQAKREGKSTEGIQP